MIEFCSVSKSYKNTTGKALANLSLKVMDGEIFAFLGQNGAGKTTAINLLTGQATSDEGAIRIDSINIQENPLEAKKKFSLVCDKSFLNEKLTGLEHLIFFKQIYDIEQKKFSERLAYYAELFSIQNVLPSIIKSYSEGMKQKLRIVASLLTDPQNWILDEPLNSLDAEAIFALRTIMKKRSENGKTTFFSTHSMEVTEKMCTKIGILHKGKLIFSGTIDQLRKTNLSIEENADLETLFFALTK